jgi:Spy/CpxP family protein refolding chaperone
MQLPPEQREKLIQQMRERRGAKRGSQLGADGGLDGGQPPDGMGPEDGPPGGPPEGGPRRPRNFGTPIKGGKFFGREPLDLTKLNLTPDQKSKIQAMRSANGQKARALHADLKQRREKFRDMLFDPNVSNEDILGMRREVNKLQTQVEDLMLTDFLGIRKLLTKEQMELLPSIRPQDPPRRIARPRKKTGGSEISDRGGDS